MPEVPKASYAREATDPAAGRVQQELIQLRTLFANCPFINGVRVPDVALTTSATRVTHKLGRKPAGFLVLSVSPDACVGLSASQNADQANAVTMEASASATFTLWFF